MIQQTHFAYLAAHVYALRSGLSFEASEDCAMVFLETECEKAGGLEKLTALCRDSPAQVRKCALNYVRNVARAEHRRPEHGSGWPQIKEENGATQAWEALADQPEPDSGMVQEAFWNMFLPFLEMLARNPREYFLRHYVGGEAVANIARAEGKAAHAIEQSLFRSREKLRTELERSGLSYDVLRQLLAPPANIAPDSSE